MSNGTGRVDEFGGLIPDTIDIGDGRGAVPYDPTTTNEPNGPTLSWSRAELDAHARSLGIANPESFGTKADVLEAIEGAE